MTEQHEIRENITSARHDAVYDIAGWLNSRHIGENEVNWLPYEAFTGFGGSIRWMADGQGEVHGVLVLNTSLDRPPVALYDELPKVVYARPLEWPDALVGSVRYELRDATVCPYSNGVTRIDVWYVWSAG